MENPSDKITGRRTFLRQAAGLGLISSSVAGLVAACDFVPIDMGGGGAAFSGYGPLEVYAPPVALPHGFQAHTFGAIGSLMSDGNLTPVAHDGMAAFAAGGGRVRLLRNHEDRNGPTQPIASQNAYDPMGGGGVVTLEVGPDRQLLRDFVSLNGTIVNCAGGPTPWGSWLSCEETTAGTKAGYEKPHGYVFEVPSSANGPVEPVPLKAMGRFSHEAVAIDPSTGIAYLTEDANRDPGSGFYRFLPNQTPGKQGSLQAGGKLQLAKVQGEPHKEMFTGKSIGQSFDITWVDVNEPDPENAEDNRSAVFEQGLEQGAARFDRLEGCWYGDGSVFFHDTSGGAANKGQVWQYIPAREKLILIFESPGSEVLDSPDNLTVSPWGGIVMCEDGGGVDFVRGLTADGKVFDIAKNILNDSEWAGATFSPDGKTLFVNIQGATSGAPADHEGEGLTVAIWGPWHGRTV